MELTKEWQPFDGDYQKKIQDIKLKNGDIVTGCWPNAGWFMVMTRKGNGKYYDTNVLCREVAFVRLTHDTWLNKEANDE